MLSKSGPAFTGSDPEMEMLIALRLPLQRVNHVLEILASAPCRTAAPLIDEIHAQVRRQVEEENQK